MKNPAITNPSEQVRIIQGAFKDIKPPKHIKMLQRDMPFFNSVIAEFAKADWSDHQVEIACLLARAMSDLEDQQNRLRKEGGTTRSERGTPVVNPRKILVQMYAGTILSLRKSLALDARSGGQKVDIAKKRGLAKEIEGSAMSMDMDDDLISRPN